MALIMQFEGLSARAYRDAVGIPTIGYGHVIAPHEQELLTRTLLPAEAEALLQVDVLAAAQAVQRFIRVPLVQYQFDALASFTFNLGSGVLQRSTLRRVLNRGEYDDVPAQLRRYVYAGGRRLLGLVRRRNAKAAVFAGQ